MLTRKQVARQIGKSIATVRKVEGIGLHPKVDAKGVHWFDDEEVEAFAERVAATGRALHDATWPGIGKAYGADHRRRSHGRGNHATKELLTGSLSELKVKRERWKQRVAKACADLLKTIPYLDDDAWDAVEQLEEILNDPEYLDC